MDDVEPEETYRQLFAELCPSPVESEEHYDKMAAQLEALSLSRKKDGVSEPGRERMIELLVTLLGVWDDEHHPDEDVSPAEMLAFTLESRGMNKAQLAREIGVKRQELTGLDTGERDFSIRLARLVSEYFGHPVGLYLRKYPKPDAA